MVTAGTYRKIHHFRSAQRLDVLERGLLTVSRDHGWGLEAWAVFSNHYHFVASAPAGEQAAASLSRMLSTLHTTTGTWVNRLDGMPGRKVWHNFFETRITYERSYFARLNYVHQNALRHGLVRVAADYRWCSARWFEQTAPRSRVAAVYGIKVDRVRVVDDYEALGPVDGGH